MVRLVLTSGKAVLVVPAPDTDVAANVVDKLAFDKPCVVIAYYVANAPGYRRVLWAHNPQIHRTETWLLYTNPVPKVIPRA